MIPTGGFSPPNWKCEDCDKIVGSRTMYPYQYEEYIEDKKIQKKIKNYKI